MRQYTTMRAAATVLAVLLLLPERVTGSSDAGRDRADLTRYSLDELMNIEVSSASRKEQRLQETSAAVFVITQDDIRRSPARTVPDLLRMVPGLHVARIGTGKWAVSARGFNGRFADKMLVLIDGRSLYNSMFSGTYWDQNDVPLEIIERIEVIRGPGATMWGANAVNGVINIITKSAAETQGAVVSADVDSNGDGLLYAGYGAKANRTAFRAYAQVRRDGPGALADGTEAPDRWRAMRFGGRADIQLSARDSITVDGGGYDQKSRQGFFTDFPLSSGQIFADLAGAGGGFGLVRWRRTLSGRSEIAVQGYLNRDVRTEKYLGKSSGWSGDLEMQHRFQPFRGHDVTWGLGYRHSAVNIMSSHPDVICFVPPERGDNLSTAFVQDEISLVEDRLSLAAGSKFQHNGYTGFEIQPNIRLSFTPFHRLMFWSAVSRAVRTPSRKDLDVLVNTEFLTPEGGVIGAQFLGSKDFRSEQLVAYEAGTRFQFSDHWAVDLAAFRNHYEQIASLKMLPPVLQPQPPYLLLPIRLVNGQGDASRGLEALVTWSPDPRFKLVGGYTWLHLRSKPNFTLFGSFADPARQYIVRGSWDITSRLFADVSAHYVSAMPANGVRGQTRLDAAFGFRLGPNVDLGLGGTGLLRPLMNEYGAGQDYGAPSQTRRAVYLRLTWRF